MTTYSKRLDAKATVGEVQQMATPAFIAARFAPIVAGISVILSAVAIALAVRR